MAIWYIVSTIMTAVWFLESRLIILEGKIGIAARSCVYVFPILVREKIEIAVVSSLFCSGVFGC